MKRLLTRLTLLSLWLVALAAPAMAANEPAKLANLAKDLDKYVEEYTGAALKDPSNKGARRLQVKLTNLQSDIATYRRGNLSRSFLEGRLKEALTEAKRYSSPTAKKLTDLLEDIQKLMPKLAQRMEAGKESNLASSSRPRAEEKPASRPSKNSDLDNAPAEERLRKSNDPSAAADDIEAAAAQEDAAEPLTDEAAATSDETTTEEGGIPSASVGTSNGSRSGGSGPVLVALGMLLVVGLFGTVAFMQHRNVQALKAQLAGRGPDGGNSAEMVQRLMQTEQQVAGLVHRTDARMASLEEMVQRLTSTLSAQAAAQQQAISRPQEHGYRNEYQPTQDPYQRPVAYAQQAAPAAKAYAETATQAVTTGATALHSSEEKAILAEVLRTLSSRTQIPQLTEIAKRVLGHYEAAVSSEPTPAEIASLIQFAYLSATLEANQEAYDYICTYYQKDSVVVEDKMQGRMAFSEAYAENINYEEFKRVAGNASAEGPDFRRIMETVEGSSLLREAVKNTVLYTRWPTVLRQKDGVKTVIQKGRYIVK